ncbi:hypothetical protein G9A89_009995 [Geosiphon pyriformis]|nr:hypothetical protein G9A89_009995 [Geosiphon pyriformis]
MNAISLDDLTRVIKNLLDGKTAGLLASGPSEHLFGIVLTNTKPIALIETAHKIFSKLLSDRISSACSLFNILHGDNFSVLKRTIAQSPIFAIGSVVKDVLEKDHELWFNS